MLGASMIVATIPVSDLEVARAFYGGVLGLEQLWENPASIRFRCGGASEVSVAHFEVADIEAAVAELEGKGVAFADYDDGPLKTTGHIAQMGPARGAWMRDPDGNFLGLRQG